MTAPIVAQPPPAPAPARRRGLLAFLLPFVGFFLLFAAWALATPYDGTPDEMRHIEHAYAVAHGDPAPAPAVQDGVVGAYQDVPRSLIRANCFAFHPSVPASCGQPPGGDRSLTSVLTPAGRYNPAYYLAVGWPLVLSPDMTGVLIARLFSAALVAALLAWAVAVAMTLRRRGVVGGLLVAVTPMTAHLAGAINPNGLEIAAGAALVVGLIAILYEHDGAPARRSPWWLVGVSGITLLTVRPAGPVWFAVVAAVLLVPLCRSRYLSLLRSRRAWTLTAALVAVALADGLWTVWKHANQLTPNIAQRLPITFVDAMKIQFFDTSRRYVSEMVGVLSWLDTPVPVAVQLAWLLSLGALVMPALASGGWAERWRIAGLAALGLLVPMAVQARSAADYGFISQGRYFLPMLVGVPILAGYVLGGRIGPGLAAQLTRLFAVLLMPLQVAVLCYLMVRYQQGLPGNGNASLNPLRGSWHPAVGSVVPIVVAVLGAGVMIVYAWRAAVAPVAASGGGTGSQTATEQGELVDAAAGPRLGQDRSS